MHIKKFVISVVSISLLSGLTSLAYADRYDRRIRINNYTNTPVIELYASPVDDPNYHYDMINTWAKVIPAHSVRVADINDGTGYCRYDIRAGFSDGTHVETEINACKLTDWNLTE